MQWYYAINNQRQGPVADEEFNRLVAAGTIGTGTLVWHEGMKDWQTYGSISGAAASGAPDDTEVCVVSGKRYPKREMIQYEGKWISAEHRDEYFQHLREGVAPAGVGAVPGPFGYGGFWRRFFARIVDTIILWVLGSVVGGVAGAIAVASGGLRNLFLFQAVMMLVGFAINATYESQFVRIYAATPGKMIFGMKVLRPDGEKLSGLRALGRWGGLTLSAMTLSIGYIMAGVDEEKRALHDRICDTRVVRTRG